MYYLTIYNGNAVICYYIPSYICVLMRKCLYCSLILNLISPIKTLHHVGFFPRNISPRRTIHREIERRGR